MSNLDNCTWIRNKENKAAQNWLVQQSFINEQVDNGEKSFTVCVKQLLYKYGGGGDKNISDWRGNSINKQDFGLWWRGPAGVQIGRYWCWEVLGLILIVLFCLYQFLLFFILCRRSYLIETGLIKPKIL